MKKQLAVLAATAVLGVTSAFAANPFSDVTPQDWAYQAVAQLAAQGVVNGYPDGAFQGQHNITRYEMAQMVAKALVRQDRVDAEQNAIINRLANEFSAELNNLGVRVATLENKVGNFKFNGDARLKFVGNEKTIDSYTYYTLADDKKVKKDHDKDGFYTDKTIRKSNFNYRGRVKFEATVNDNTKAVIRVTADKEFGGKGTPAAEIDRIYVQHNFGKYVTATAGRHDLFVGGGLTYDGVTEGATVMVGKDALNASVTYGYAPDLAFKVVQGNTKDKPGTAFYKESAYADNQRDNAQLTVFQINGKVGPKVDLGAFYTKVSAVRAGNTQHMADVATYLGVKEKDLPKATEKLDFYGVHANADLGHNVKVDGEFAKFSHVKHSNAWTAGIAYGAYDMKKAGTWMLKAQYVDLDVLAPVFSSTFWTPYNQNFKTWAVSGKYAVAKNIGLAAYSTIGAKDKQGNDVAEYYRAELNYKF